MGGRGGGAVSVCELLPNLTFEATICVEMSGLPTIVKLLEYDPN